MTSRTSFLVNALFVTLVVCFTGLVAAQDNHDMSHDGPAMNFHRVSPQLATGGHFMDGGIATLVEQGVTVVIDLRDQPPEGQEKRLAAAGIRWINVPVVWKSPQREDFEDFSRFMTENKEENIFVQCQANYRASAMTYMYRVTKEGVPESEAREDMNAIWTPEGTWKTFIDDVLATSQ